MESMTTIKIITICQAILQLLYTFMIITACARLLIPVLVRSWEVINIFK